LILFLFVFTVKRKKAALSIPEALLMDFILDLFFFSQFKHIVFLFHHQIPIKWYTLHYKRFTFEKGIPIK